MDPLQGTTGAQSTTGTSGTASSRSMQVTLQNTNGLGSSGSFPAVMTVREPDGANGGHPRSTFVYGNYANGNFTPNASNAPDQMAEFQRAQRNPQGTLFSVSPDPPRNGSVVGNPQGSAVMGVRRSDNSLAYVYGNYANGTFTPNNSNNQGQMDAFRAAQQGTAPYRIGSYTDDRTGNTTAAQLNAVQPPPLPGTERFTPGSPDAFQQQLDAIRQMNRALSSPNVGG